MMRLRASGCTVACRAQGVCHAPETGGARLTEALKATTCSSTFAHAHRGIPYCLRVRIMMLALLAAAATASSAPPAAQCSAKTQVAGQDLYGGDLQPLGRGFRNATDAVDCCRQCSETHGCAFFATSAAKGAHTPELPGFPPHNCWLKSTAGVPKAAAGRTSGCVPTIPSGCSVPTPTAKEPDACFPPGGKPPTAAWCDTSKSFPTRVASLVSALTLEEKIAQIATYTPSTVPGVPRVGLPSFSYHSEGLHGLRNSFDTLGLNATLFPQVTAMAATGNMSLVKEMGRVMLQEARALSNYATDHGKGPFGRGSGLFYWSPTMNLGRDPRWGRFQESVSEDPHLNGMYSASMLQGFQGDDPTHLGVAATCKHFVGYSLEGGPAAGGFSRHNFNAVISEQDLQESYLPGFKLCVTHGKPAQIMCSYNAINGIPSCLHGDFMNGIVRNQWGYDGLIVSDQDSIRDAWAGTTQAGHTGHFYGNSFANVTALGIKAGCDQNDGNTYSRNGMDAVKQGLMAESDVDRALSRILLQRFRTGAFDPKEHVSFRSIPVATLDSAEHRAIALQASREAITLLANVDNTLPLAKSAVAKMRIGVVGPFADYAEAMAGGKPDYHPSFTVSLLEGIQAMVNSLGGREVSYAAGSPVAGNSTDPEAPPLDAALAVARTSDVLVVCVGIDQSIEHEGSDRTTIGLPPVQLAMLKAVTAAVQKDAKVVVVLVNGGPLSIDWLKSSIGASPPVVHAALEAFDLGQSGGQVLAEVLVGDINPSESRPEPPLCCQTVSGPPTSHHCLLVLLRNGNLNNSWRLCFTACAQVALCHSRSSPKTMSIKLR